MVYSRKKNIYPGQYVVNELFGSQRGYHVKFKSFKGIQPSFNPFDLDIKQVEWVISCCPFNKWVRPSWDFWIFMKRTISGLHIFLEYIDPIRTPRNLWLSILTGTLSMSWLRPTSTPRYINKGLRSHFQTWSYNIQINNAEVETLILHEISLESKVLVFWSWRSLLLVAHILL